MGLISKLIIAWFAFWLVIGIFWMIVISIIKKEKVTPESKILRDIEERKRQAEKLGIAPAIVFILDALGLDKVSDSWNKILLRRVEDRVTATFAGAIVFEAKIIPEWTYSFERKVIEPSFDGEGLVIKNKTDSVTLPLKYEIDSYIPGGWEQRLAALRAITEKRQRADELERARLEGEEKQRKLEEQRKRFGV